MLQVQEALRQAGEKSLKAFLMLDVSLSISAIKFFLDFGLRL